MTQEMKYASFRDRANRLTLIGLLLLVIPVGMAIVKTHTAGLVVIGFGICLLLLYIFIRKKFVHLCVVDKNGRPANYLRDFLNASMEVAAILLTIFLLYLSLQFCPEEACSFQFLYDLAYFLPLSIILASLIHIIFQAPILFTREKTSLSNILSGTRVVYSEGVKTKTRKVFDGFLTIMTVLSYGVFATIFSAASAYTVLNLFDRPLDPDVAVYFPADPFVAGDNVYVAWNGLRAPPGTQDIYDYGLKSYKNEIAHDEKTELALTESSGTFCHDAQDREKYEDCLPESEVLKNFEANAEIISRYRSLYQYGRHSIGDAPFGFKNSKAQDIIQINQLLAAYWAIQAERGQAEEALQWWIDNMRFMQKMQAGKHTMVEQAIWMINYGLSLKVLPVLIADPVLAQKYREPVTEILSKEFPDPEIWNIPATMRAEYAMWRVAGLTGEKSYTEFSVSGAGYMENDVEIPEGSFHVNDSRNRFLKMTKEFLRISQLPPDEIIIAMDDSEFSKNCSKPLCTNMLYNPVPQILIPGMWKGGELIVNTYWTAAKTRALRLLLMARAQDIPPEAMPEFLAAAGPELRDPFTQQPFLWDAAQKSIYFAKIDHRGEERRIDVYYPAAD